MDKQTASSLQRPEIRYLLILGCTVRGDQPTQLLQTRIDRAAQYLKLHPQTIAVASGGCFRAGQQTSEAAVIQKGLCAKGIAPERILIEDQARSTAENFTLCKHLLESREGWDETETIAFVTNDFHVARCLKIACQNRLHVVPVFQKLADVCGCNAKTCPPALPFAGMHRLHFRSVFRKIRLAVQEGIKRMRRQNFAVYPFTFTNLPVGISAGRRPASCPRPF